MDISAAISHAWATSDPEDYVSPSIGLAQVDGIIRRVEVFGKYLLLVDEGQLVPFRNAQLRPATKEILNIPPLAFPVVLSDFETLTDRQITKLDELVMGYIIYDHILIQIRYILEKFNKISFYNLHSLKSWQERNFQYDCDLSTKWYALSNHGFKKFRCFDETNPGLDKV